jgi:hypothetical protein
MYRLLFSIICLWLVAGCATYTVNYDFDPEADFSRFKTYAWSPSERLGVGELTAKRLRIAVNGEMATKGFGLDPENPDILVYMSAGKERRVDVEEWEYGRNERDAVGGAWYPGRYPFAPDGRDRFEVRRGVDTYEYEVGTLLIDVIDAHTNELIWRGTASGIVDPGKTAEQIQDVVARMLVNFPPPKGE